MYVGPHVMYPLFLSDFNETLDRFSKNTKISIFMESRPLEAEFHADGQTWQS
jgi:hypothetical protein